MLTAREDEVLRAVGRRLINAEIAAELSISKRTVESHVSALLAKLGAADRLALVRLGADRPDPGGGEGRTPTRAEGPSVAGCER